MCDGIEIRYPLTAGNLKDGDIFVADGYCSLVLKRISGADDSVTAEVVDDAEASVSSGERFSIPSIMPVRSCINIMPPNNEGAGRIYVLSC